MESRYADQLIESGALLLRCSSFYKHLESSQEAGIADPMEGEFTRCSRVTLLTDLREASAEEEHVARRLFRGLENAPGFTLKNISLTETVLLPPCLVFCASRFDGIPSQFDSRYDATVEIVDPKEFASAVSGELMRRLGRHIDEPRMRACLYRNDKALNFRESPTNAAFVKPKRFRQQAEYRMVWNIHDQQELAIHTLAAAKYCRRIR